MPYQASRNTAHSGDPSTVVHTLSNTTRTEAQRFATRNPNIRCFVYCREDVQLPAGRFRQGDAVFFSGTPAPADAPGADLITKSYLMTAYSVTNRPGRLRDVGCYQLSDGTPPFDIAILFAGTIIGNADAPVISLNREVISILNGSAISDLQDLGMVVLLSVAGGRQDAGWSCCANETVAGALAQELTLLLEEYSNLDGIDIDDEYSNGTTYDDSLIMVASAFHQSNPGATLTKALWNDSQYFAASWNGQTLAEQLDYGWEMTYGDSGCVDLLSPYVKAGMSAAQLFGGVDAGTSTSPRTLSKCIVTNGYGGMAVWLVGDATTSYLSEISNPFFQSDTTTPEGCIPS